MEIETNEKIIFRTFARNRIDRRIIFFKINKDKRIREIKNTRRNRERADTEKIRVNRRKLTKRENFVTDWGN